MNFIDMITTLDNNPGAIATVMGSKDAHYLETTAHLGVEKTQLVSEGKFKSVAAPSVRDMLSDEWLVQIDPENLESVVHNIKGKVKHLTKVRLNRD